ADFVPSETSVAVAVQLPAVLKVTAKVCVPATSAALAGFVSFASVVVMPAVAVTVLTKFQFASTALTVTFNAVPAVCGVGVRVLPQPLPGEADSPGTRICNLTNAPAFTVIVALVPAVMPG